MSATTTDPVRELLGHLDGVKSAGQGKWAARCPAHDDHRASLSITTGDDGRALLRCHAGCAVNDICAKLGMKMADLFPPKANGNGRHAGPKIVATYDYCDADGTLRYQAVRFTPKDFRQRRPDGNGGWTWNMNGVQRVLYRLPDLLNAFDDRPDDWILIGEGEKDVDRLYREGFTATCNVGGAGKWKDEYSETLRGRCCCIIADKDTAGRKHAQQAAASLHGKAADVKIVECPGDGVKDASDFFDAGATTAQLLALIDAAPKWTPTTPNETKANNDHTIAVDQSPPLTEYGNAQRLVQQHGALIHFDAARGEWLTWTGKRWEVDTGGAVVRLAKKTARSFLIEAKRTPDQATADKLLKHGKASEKANAIAAMLTLTRSEPAITIIAEQRDADPFALNVLNGTIDLRTGELRPHNRDDLLTKLAPVEYDAKADCPLWRSFLNRAMDGNETLIAYLQRIAGLCLSGDVTVQELFIFHGTGANGKSVWLDTVAGLLGDYACEAAPSLLTTRSHDEHPTEVADLAGRRLVVASETEEGARLRVQLVKRLTGNARIKGRFMRQDYFEFPRTHKLILVTNNMPMIRETTNAVWRRIRLVPFNVTIPPAEQDPMLLAKLRGEWPAILRWAVDGCLAWQRDGMRTPREVTVATEAYQAEQDPLAEFISARCVVGDDVNVSRAELLAAYQQWSKATVEPNPMDRNTLYEHVRRVPRVGETMLRIHGKPTHVFTGIGLADLANEYRRAQAGVTAG
jgi:putative DNA primase/helicase